MTFAADDLTPENLRAMPLDKRIYRLRKSLDLSQDEVAEKVGVNVKTVNRWENADATPQRQSREALAELTGYPESMFKRKPPAPSATHLDPQNGLLAKLAALVVRLEEAVSLLAAAAERLDRDGEEPGPPEEKRRPV